MCDQVSYLKLTENGRHHINLTEMLWLLAFVPSLLPCGSNRAFVDLGANDGQSLLWFEQKLLRSSPSKPFTSVTAFEMNPFFREPLRTILARLPGGNLEHAAAWVSDGQMQAHMQLPGSRTATKGGVLYNMTASALSGKDGVPLNRKGGGLKRSRRHESVMQVRTVDLAAWLSARFCALDWVFLKVDIEGAEFEVFEHLLATSTAELIDQASIEWHTSKRGVKRSRAASIEARLRRAGMRLMAWGDARLADA